MEGILWDIFKNQEAKGATSLKQVSTFPGQDGNDERTD
jgi:hypothetical protein